MKKLAIEPGLRFGRLVVKGFSHVKTKKRYFACICDCGIEKPVRIAELLKGQQSCGCLTREMNRERMAARKGLPSGSRRDLTGQVFGRLTVSARLPREAGSGPTKYRCACECGVVKTIIGTSLTGGNTKSCGCLRSDLTVMRHTTHGMFSGSGKMTREYRIWTGMKTRCTNPKSISYRYYGGRGVKVCDRWMGSFAAFLEDVGKVPAPYSIDRINPDGDYEPGNVRLASPREQAQNRRNTRM